MIDNDYEWLDYLETFIITNIKIFFLIFLSKLLTSLAILFSNLKIGSPWPLPNFSPA